MDINLFYQEVGEGFPLILLHGNGESSDYFANQIEFFSKYYKVIAIDTRGHGQSQKGQALFTLSQFADDLFEFMKLHQINKAHILGFSDGGNIALLFALKHQNMVEKLILNGANLDTSGVKPSVQIFVELGYHIVSLFSRFNKKLIDKKDILSLMHGQPNISPKDIHNLAIPSLVIVGTNDMIKDSHSQLISDSIPNCQIVRIKGSHFIAAECSEAFNKEVLQFLIKK